MGTRISGSPSWASTAPSRNTTAECTMLSGCTTTSIRSSGMSNSHRASMISRPLLNMLAESTVIFAPMFQFGCFSASAGVAFSMRSFSHFRKGPPEAVSRIFSARLPPALCRHWKIALCSLSTGSSGFPIFFARSVTRWPPVTSASLLASSTCRPAPSASITLRSPAIPTMLTSTMSASTSAAAACRASFPLRKRQNFRSDGISAGSNPSVSPAISGRNSRTCSNSFSLLPRAVKAVTR